MNRIPALLMWLTMIAIVWIFAPSDEIETTKWVLEQLTIRWSNEGPWVIAWFWLMGLWPALMSLLMRADWNARPPAWPFLVASFVLGCYALLPWFVLRREPRRVAEDGWLARWDVPVGIAFLGLLLVAWATATGHPMDVYQSASSNAFAFAMAADFLAFWGLSIVEARARAQRTAWQYTLIPLVGLGIFLGMEESRRKASSRGAVDSGKSD
jgi:hypothetical protein